ncbi:MAG: hypothetical protein HY865_07740 [Chloroflexi bacterium]|nr:hypothetical protein [Chloroflexota bacterium]
MFKNGPGLRFRLFIYLASIEFLLSGTITAFLAVRQGLEATLIISILIAFAGLSGIFIPVLLKQRDNIEKRVMDISKGMIVRSLPFIIIFLLAAFFCFANPDAHTALLLSPLFVCGWLIGVELLLLFDPAQSYEEGGSVRPADSKKKVIGITSALLAYGFLLLPSHIPTWLDGIPWDTSIEFVFGAFALPLIFITGWKFFAKRFYIFSFGFLLLVKFVLFSLLPQAGLGIYAFSNEESFLTSQWERSYQTLAIPGYTEVINRPYYGLREFPIEWINKRFGFEENEFWLKLELSGYINLQKNERLVFIAQGARSIQVEFLDTNTQETVPIEFIEKIEDANDKLYESIPNTREVKIQGTLLFDIYGTMRLEPIILYADGSTKSPFKSTRIWTTLDGANYPVNQVNTFSLILDTLSLLFMSLILVGLSIGIRTLWKDGKISMIDLYLASSGLPLFFVVMLVHKQYMNVLALSILLVFFAVKSIELSLRQCHMSGKVFLFSVGIATLFMFIALDIHELRMVNSFPTFHDGHEYQIFAHNIYVNQDIFLVNTPPRAYKVLFPYIVGALHVLFGQSVTPQLFFYAWCAVLSSAILIEIAKELRMTIKASLIAAVYYLLTLFLPSLYMYYFRFGLIEPFSTASLFLTIYFAIKRQRFNMFLTGMVTVLLRLDYLGITFSAILLMSDPMVGAQKATWVQFFDWLKKSWKLLIAYAVALCLPAFIFVLGYFLFTPDYKLNAADTDQTSLMSVVEGMVRVIAGGTPGDLREKISDAPTDVFLIYLPLLFGFSLVLASVFLRTGILKQLDLRLGLIALSLLPAYIFVRPTVYLPRFSLPLLPIDLILISLFLHQLRQWKLPNFK